MLEIKLLCCVHQSKYAVCNHTNFTISAYTRLIRIKYTSKMTEYYRNDVNNVTAPQVHTSKVDALTACCVGYIYDFTSRTYTSRERRLVSSSNSIYKKQYTRWRTLFTSFWLRRESRFKTRKSENSYNRPDYSQTVFRLAYNSTHYS